MKTKSKIARKDTMIHLEQFHLACELLSLIKHFFPELVSLLKKTKGPRHQSYITYEKEILLMTKILSSIFYIESMRKTSEEFNCREAIENVKTICGNDDLEQLPHWTKDALLKPTRTKKTGASRPLMWNMKNSFCWKAMRKTGKQKDGRRRWKIEKEGFNTQKCHGYRLEHRYSEDYNGMKNHYYLIQIGHMIAQLLENWEKLWFATRVSQGEKHKKLLESFKKDQLKELYKETREIQIRFI